MKEWTTEELAHRLRNREALSLLDIREERDYQDWHIPGSSNFPAYQSLKSGELQAFKSFLAALPTDRPIVTICHRGNTSKYAAEIMEAHGLQAVSLAGGMAAWGSVWSVAEVDFAAGKDPVFFQIRRNGKGCLSYLFGASGEAAVVDPVIDADAYVKIAHDHGLRISHVFETHVHADHVSRARTLCKITGASLHMAANRRVTYPYQAVPDGQVYSIGGLSLKALATPGHTHESVCYLVDSRLLLSGDTLFTEGVGRPDLEHGHAGVDESAALLHGSLHERLLRLPGDVRVFPGHTSLPIGFDGIPLEARLEDLKGQIELLRADQEEFVSLVKARLIAHPPNFENIIAVNEGKLELGDVSPFDLEAGPNRCAVV